MRSLGSLLRDCKPALMHVRSPLSRTAPTLPPTHRPAAPTTPTLTHPPRSHHSHTPILSPPHRPSAPTTPTHTHLTSPTRPLHTDSPLPPRPLSHTSPSPFTQTLRSHHTHALRASARAARSATRTLSNPTSAASASPRGSLAASLVRSVEAATLASLAALGLVAVRGQGGAGEAGGVADLVPTNAACVRGAGSLMEIAECMVHPGSGDVVVAEVGGELQVRGGVRACVLVVGWVGVVWLVMVEMHGWGGWCVANVQPSTYHLMSPQTRSHHHKCTYSPLVFQHHHPPLAAPPGPGLHPPGPRFPPLPRPPLHRPRLRNRPSLLCPRACLRGHLLRQHRRGSQGRWPCGCR